jgi:transcriptional regulator with XRE-family HTH domain
MPLPIRKQIREKDKLVGARLRSMRTAAKLSQSDLGEALGITFQQIQKYENGANRISGSSIIQLCKILKTSPDKLLGIATNGAGVEIPLDLLDDPHVRKALQALYELPEKRRSAVARAMLALAQAFA